MVEMTVASRRDEKAEEDGKVVAGVYQGRSHHGAQAKPDRGEDQRDEKKQCQNGPREAGLHCVHQREEDAGEHRREEERWEREGVGGVPLLAGGWDARQREPVVGDREARQEEAAEEDLFEERAEQNAEGGDDPGIAACAKKSSMGTDLGVVMRDEMARTINETVMPMGIRRRALRMAAEPFSWRPAANDLCQKSGKTNHEIARVAM